MTARSTPLHTLGAVVLQRDWLSANHVVFASGESAPATVVDTGYQRHQALSLALIDHALAGEPLARIVNTHLHSDHCGGNHALQARSPGLETLVPAGALQAVQAWQAGALSYERTGQQCPRFHATGSLHHGQWLRLGPADWQVQAAPGHDPDAVMLFEPQTRTLLAGDALWEGRLAIIFPELEDRPGFAATRATLALIESLQPRSVIPGHGAVFEDVGSALAASRRRLGAFEQEPLRHVRHAARALLMFHLMEVEALPRPALMQWLQQTPLFVRMAAKAAPAQPAARWGASLIDSLLDDGLLSSHHDTLTLGGAPAA